MTIVVTGAAGFIGFHVSNALMARGEDVIGIDNLNDYYDVKLKESRLERLKANPKFAFHKLDFADFDLLSKNLENTNFDRVIHLGAQPGVRYSLENPFAYAQSNLLGHLSILELCRHKEGFKHLVYASSSSVYGGNKDLPYLETQNVDSPVSLYAATKKSDELMSQSYAHLYGIPSSGLRFFTVYGPWGRPDMAYWLFTDKILKGEPIEVFNNGDMNRDFTYIDDIVEGILGVLDLPPQKESGAAPHRVLNIGNNRSVRLTKMIDVLENALGKKAETVMKPMQMGDVKDTYADITKIRDLTGFQPKTDIEIGLPKFVNWYRDFYS